MVDDRLIEVGRPSPAQLHKRGLEWFVEGDNHDYLAPEMLRLTKAEMHGFGEAARLLYRHLCLAAEQVAAKGRWADAGIPDHAVEAVQHSMRHEWGQHLVSRFDFAGGLGHAPLKMLELNADTLSLLPETATIQGMMSDSLPWRKRMSATQWNALMAELVRTFTQIRQRHRHRQPHILLIGMGHEEDWLNLDAIGLAAEKAGFQEVHRAALPDVTFSEEEGVFLEVEPGQFLQYDFVFKMVPWDFIAYEEPGLMAVLTKIQTLGLAVILNPAYTMLLQSKALMAMLPEFGIQHPALLRTTRRAADFPDLRYVEKPIFGRTGDNVRFFDGSPQPLAANDGDFGHLPKVHQEQALFDLDSDGCRYQPSVFLSAEEPCALCFRRQDDLIVDDDAEFVAHYIHG